MHGYLDSESKELRLGYRFKLGPEFKVSVAAYDRSYWSMLLCL